MTADENIKLWASKKIDVPVDKIEKVDFVHTDEYHYSEYTWEPACDAAIVHFTEPVQHPSFGDQLIHTYSISLDTDDFGALIREILEAAS